MDNLLGVRILRLPACKMVTSLMDTGTPFAPEGRLRLFDEWFSKVDASDAFTPRDFLWYEPDAPGMEWWYVYSEGMDTGGFDVVDFPGGLYAAAISRDEDDTDGTRVYEGIKEWIAARGCFELDERPGHRTMFHVITPPAVKEAMGFHQLDIFVPIKLKQA
jgi:hypothetical protein